MRSAAPTDVGGAPRHAGGGIFFIVKGGGGGVIFWPLYSPVLFWPALAPQDGRTAWRPFGADVPFAQKDTKYFMQVSREMGLKCSFYA